MDQVPIRDSSIRLGQALKLHGIAEDGFMAKQLVHDGQVRVNGEVETRRGATLNIGDRVATLGAEFEIVPV